jgi:hypothetical protein
MKREKPKYWKSLKTDIEYQYSDYSNIEEPKMGFLPLPKDGYPYTIIFEETNK